MTAYIVRRLILSAAAAVVLLITVFVVSHSLGDPASIILPIGASDEMLQAMRHRLGLDQPLYVQFFNYAKGAVQGDLGTSLVAGEPTIELIFQRLPRTYILSFAAIALAGFLGTLLGILAGLRPRSAVDRLVSMISLFGASSVEFWVGLMLIMLIAVRLGWLPTSGYGDWQNLILPAVTLASRPIARIAMVTRPAVIEEYQKPYVTALTAKGISAVRLRLHVLRNVAIVVLTMLAYEFAGMINGAIVVETVFAWPGVGLLLIDALHARDWPLIVGITLVVSTVVIVLHLLIDLLYGWINPRVKYE